MSLKFILALQYHYSDRDQAIRLAKLIADIEPARRDDVGLLFVNRFDSEPMDNKTIFHVLQKMPVFSYQTETKRVGWPDGCNAMAIDTLKRVAHGMTHNEQWKEVEGVLLLEPDCIPTAHGWIDMIVKEWMAAQVGGNLLMGTWRDGGGPLGHINGNMVVNPFFANLYDLDHLPDGLAWDCAISLQVHKDWRITKLICNRWNERNLTPEQITQHRDDAAFRPVLVHGVKDESVLKFAEEVAQFSIPGSL